MVELDEERGWIRNSQQGDQEAFAALVRHHQQMIHALTYRMTGSPTEADDLAQETFIQAFLQLNHFRGEARFSSWLYRIAVNLCLNWRKRRERQGRLQAAWLEDQAAATSAAPESRLTDRIQEALLQLKPKQRAAVVLTIYEGLSHAEAARVLGCSETTVSWRLFAARRKLKRLLQHLHHAGGAA
jgi:RNA polymerase sigma-70 factor (ECF subfamily)